MSCSYFVVNHDGFVDRLLELGVFEITADHRFECLEQFSIGNVPVLVNVVNSAFMIV